MDGMYDLHIGGIEGETHTCRVVDGSVVDAFRWIPGGEFSRNTNTRLPRYAGMSVADLHQIGFSKCADQDAF